MRKNIYTNYFRETEKQEQMASVHRAKKKPERPGLGKRATMFLAFSFLVLLMPFLLQAQSIEHVTRIWTSWNGGWASGVGNINSLPTDDDSFLLGFEVDGEVYSTGVDDAMLGSLLAAEGITSYTQAEYSALPVNHLAPRSGTYIGIPYRWEGTVQEGAAPGYAEVPVEDLAWYLNQPPEANGMNLGTAMFNFESASAGVEYPVDEIFPGASANLNGPAIIVTQMGQPSSSNDTFRFVNVSGNTVGNEIQVLMGGIAPVGEQIWAFFDPVTFQYSSSQPGDGPPSQNTRDTRLGTFSLADFGLDETNIGDVAGFVHVPSKDSDMAFVATNQELFRIITADLEIEKSVEPTSAAPGETVTFTLTATNHGPDNATGVQVDDQLPSGYDFGSAAPSTGTTYNAGTGVWDIGTLNVGNSATLTITAKVLATGSYRNVAVIEGSQPDPDLSNNRDVADITEITVNLTGGPCWRLLSSPDPDITYAEFLTDFWTQGGAGSNYSPGDPNVFVWDTEFDGGGTGGWVPVTNFNQQIPPGTGFLMSVFEDDVYGTPGSWPKPLTYTGAGNVAPLSPNEMNIHDEGWTLLGNPFTSPIDFSELNLTDVAGVAYIYDRNIPGWRSTTSDEYGEIADGIISPFQGFFVYNDGTSPSVEFTEASRTTGGEFYGKEQNRLRDFVRLEVTGQDISNSMWLRFTDGGSEEFISRRDAFQLEPMAERYVFMAARKTDGTLVDIGHYPALMAGQNLTIPVQFTTTHGGTYTLAATDLNLPAGAELYFEDLHTGFRERINTSFSYTFTIQERDVEKSAKAPASGNGVVPCSSGPEAAKANGDDIRFVITSAGDGSLAETGEIPSQTSLDQNFPNPFNPTTQITYQLPKQAQVTLSVYDMAGRHVSTLVNENVSAGTHTVNFDASSLSSGVYMYRLNAGSTVLTRKLTLIK